MQITAAKEKLMTEWMISKLEAISEADSAILAEFVTAILTQEQEDGAPLQTAVIDQLSDLLGDATVPFVEDLFAKFVKTPPKPPIKPVKVALPRVAKQQPNQRKAGRDTEKKQVGKKRKLQQAREPRRDGIPNNRSSTSPQLKRTRSALHRQNRRQALGMTSDQTPFFNLPKPPTPPPGFPAFDPSNPMASFTFMHSIMSQVGQQPNTHHVNQGFKMRCPDYDQTGFCSLGHNCLLEHSDAQPISPGVYSPTSPSFGKGFGQNGFPGGKPKETARSDQKQNHTFHNRVKRNGSAEGLAQDPKVKTLIVEQIPDASYTEPAIRRFFSKFGTVQEVQMKISQRLAIVTFEQKAAAYQAWSSPLPVFNNRFVKVYWHRPDPEPELVSNGHQRAESVEIDYDAFLKNIEEKQKIHEERREAKAATDKARQEIIVRRESMEQDLDGLLKKLAIAEGREHEAPDQGKDSSSAKVKALREQLSKMQAEAKSLGIDFKSPANGPGYSLRASSWSTGGQSASKVRYGGFSPRGSHSASYFTRGQPSRNKNLDNRPKTIAISGVEFDQITDENLRTYLALSGPFETVEPNPSRADSRLVHFARRWQAETIMFGNRNIPGVGAVELAWIGPSVSQTASSVPMTEEAGSWSRDGDDELEVEERELDDLDVAGGDDNW